MSIPNRLLVLALLIATAVSRPARADDPPAFRFEVGFPRTLSEQPVDGRIVLVVSTEPEGEPRHQVVDGPKTQQAFGIDVDALKPGQAAVIDGEALGYPLESLRKVPAGTYRVQAVLQRYETVHRADRHTIKVPMDRGEGRQWDKTPGNFYSTPKPVTFDPAQGGVFRVEMDRVIPEIPSPEATKFIKHERVLNDRLSKFWGRPIELGAHVLLPAGFDEHPDARYPLVIFHGHFPHTFDGFREEPPDPNLAPVYEERFHWPGYDRTVQEHAHQFYKDWTGPDYPRMIIVVIQHANPYYDDSYAVNSANLGPYGDAITYDLIPHLEKKYRALGSGWARFLYGGSTGGWEALAAQMFYPREYNGCWAACPDPIDFRAYTVVNLYEDKNAYRLTGPFLTVPRPALRNWLGHVSCTLEDVNRRELVLGTHGRSGQQWDIWEAVFSPVGPDGYPKRIWDKRTGVIDPEVAAYWKENYDLSHILKRDWPKFGKDLEGKIHIYVGDMDNYYLNNAVYLVEELLKSTKDPYYGGEVAYGDRAEHCWNGDPTRPNALSRLRYHQMYAPKILDRLLKTAPAGADVTSWRY